MAVVQACEDVIAECKKRAALDWGIDEEQLEWKDGQVEPGPGVNADITPMSLAEIAGKAVKTGGPIQGRASVNAQGAGATFAINFCDVEVDSDTGKVDLLSYTAIQDAGKAIHPSYVEGQMQGGAVQGIGWALNEEYIYGDDGRLQNAGFLDYRIPVCSDLPMSVKKWSLNYLTHEKFKLANVCHFTKKGSSIENDVIVGRNKTQQLDGYIS